MAHATRRLSADVPGKMESHPAHTVSALQERDPDDLQQTMCEITHENDKRPVARADEEAFRLHLQFMRAHGVPKGEFTTFSNAGSFSGNGMHDGRPAAKR